MTDILLDILRCMMLQKHSNFLLTEASGTRVVCFKNLNECHVFFRVIWIILLYINSVISLTRSPADRSSRSRLQQHVLVMLPRQPVKAQPKIYPLWQCHDSTTITQSTFARWDWIISPQWLRQCGSNYSAGSEHRLQCERGAVRAVVAWAFGRESSSEPIGDGG